MDIAIQFKSLTDQVHDYLSNAIVEGIIKPGEQLFENTLSQQFGTSRSPLRECFKILESEGLITIYPRKGVFVNGITPKNIEDAFPVRAALEGLAARLAIPNINEKEIEILNDLVRKMENVLAEKDVKPFLRFNDSFHSTFIKASGNQILEKTLRNLGKGTWLRIAFLYYNSPSGLDVSNKMHKKIVKAFQNKDSESVERFVNEHLEHAKHQILINLAKNQAVI